MFTVEPAAANQTIARLPSGMARRFSTPPDDNDTDGGPSAADIEKFSDVTRTCPKCKAEMYDDVEICWQCGHALMSRDTTGAPKWVIVVSVLVLASFLVVSLRGC